MRVQLSHDRTRDPERLTAGITTSRSAITCWCIPTAANPYRPAAATSSAPSPDAPCRAYSLARSPSQAVNWIIHSPGRPSRSPAFPPMPTASALDRLHCVVGIVVYRLPERREPGPLARLVVGRVEFAYAGEGGADDRALDCRVDVGAVPRAGDRAILEQPDQCVQGRGGRREQAVVQGERVTAVRSPEVNVHHG